MAGELELAYGVTGRTLYAVIRTSVGTVWNGATFETYNGANWTTYDMALTEQGTSGYYVGDFPVVSVGVYNIEVRDRAGGSPATTDPLAGSGQVEWDGSVVTSIASRIPLANMPTNWPVMAIAPVTGYVSTNVVQVAGVDVELAGAIDSNLVSILDTAITETNAGDLAEAFITFFDVDAPVFTAESVNQSGDSFARIGATGSGLTSLASQSSVNDIPTNAEFASAMALLATSAQLVKVLAAVYDSAASNGTDTLTLSNGATQLINLLTGARTTTP